VARTEAEAPRAASPDHLARLALQDVLPAEYHPPSWIHTLLYTLTFGLLMARIFLNLRRQPSVWKSQVGESETRARPDLH